MLALPLLSACGEETAKAQGAKSDTAARPVLIHRVAYEEKTPERGFVGTIRPRIESDLGFRVAGKVARRLVNVGDPVRQGQPLATLDEVDAQLQVEQAEAERAAASAAVTQGEADLKRALTLQGQGWTATANVDRQKSVTEEARSRLLRAERALSLARNTSSYAVLAADADGVVTATLVEPGQVVTAGQTALRLARTGEKEAVVAIPEGIVERARRGRAAVSLWSHPGKSYAATLRELSPAADTATRTYLAKFSLPDADEAVRLGMTATVVLSDPASERVARLPLSALFNQGEGPAVWIVDRDGRPALRPVAVASYASHEVLVTGGVETGDAVVALGVQKLDPGQRVRVVQALAF